MTDDVMYLTRLERAKNILQNEVASDFVFILKMRKNPLNFGSKKMTMTGQIRTCESIFLATR